MQDDTILDAPDAEVQNPVFELIKWCERRRFWFNVAVFLAGVVPLVGLTTEWSIHMLIIDITIYGIAVNFCFTLGWLPEIWCQAVLKKSLGMERAKHALYWIGLILSILVTFILGVFIAPRLIIP